MIKSISCPHCKKQSSMAEDNPFRPFCCERCKLIDLGEWATESYRIPTPDKPTDQEDNDKD